MLLHAAPITISKSSSLAGTVLAIIHRPMSALSQKQTDAVHERMSAMGQKQTHSGKKSWLATAFVQAGALLISHIAPGSRTLAPSA